MVDDTIQYNTIFVYCEMTERSSTVESTRIENYYSNSTRVSEYSQQP